MFEADYIYPTNDILLTLKKFYDLQVYQTDAYILYRGQTPCVVHLLLSGKVILKKNRKQIELNENVLLEANNALSKSPISYDIWIAQNSKVILIDRKSFQELLRTNIALQHVLKSYQSA